MVLINDCNTDYPTNLKSKIYLNSSTNLELPKPLKTVDYFDYIYSYPPKINITWDAMDELREDLFLSTNYGVLEHSIPFMDFIEDWFFNDTTQEAVSDTYEKSEYIDGFFDKINSSNFFSKKTKRIQSSLAHIPIYVIVNGQGEIVLGKPTNVLEQKTVTNYINGKLYDSCGAFDPLVEKKSELGLFFMNRQDAESSLKEVARSDYEGTKTVGLAIHCISLESAYKITREYHPGIDFRFVPDFQELKRLQTKTGHSDFIFEDEQQQLRFRRRNVKSFSLLNKAGLVPFSSFLHSNEYFKGVPIYIVQVSKTPRNFLFEQYFNVVGSIDTFYSRCLHYLDYTVGFGHNWIMQGSIKEQKKPNIYENFVFFEKNQALKFAKTKGRKVVRYKGSQTPNLEFLVRKPKIFVYNLEDFIEDWEDQIFDESLQSEIVEKKTLLANANNFIIPSTNSDYLTGYEESQTKNILQFLEVKGKVFKRAIGIFFSVS